MQRLRSAACDSRVLELLAGHRPRVRVVFVLRSADGTGSAGPGSVGGASSDAGDSSRRRSDTSDTSTSASMTPTGTGPRKARATRRRKSAPDLALAVK